MYKVLTKHKDGQENLWTEYVIQLKQGAREITNAASKTEKTETKQSYDSKTKK